MRQVAHLIVATAVLAGCSEHSPVQPKQPLPNAQILDGAHSDGNPDFFFLPPLVANPRGSLNFDPGKFNPRLSPIVEVCELVDNPILLPTTDCKTGPLVFGPAGMALAGIDDDDPPDIDDDEGHYKLNWDTKASELTVGRFYRVTVRGAVGGTALGFLDVEPVLGGVKKMKEGDVFLFRDDRTLPIKVRIEQGAFGTSNGDDRVEQVVPNVLPSTGLDVTTSTGFAGAHFSNGWLPVVNGKPLDQVVVIIERVPLNNGSPGTSCLNTPLEQLEGCYRFRTDPDLHTLVPGTDLPFVVPAIVGICFQYPADIGSPTGRPFDLYRSEETVEGLAPAQPLLDEVAAPFLRCSGFGPTPPSIPAAFRSGRLGDIAKAGLFAVTHAIGRVIQPAALHAVDLGAGGTASGFSRFGWARHAMLSATVSAATAPAGSQIQATALVDNSHNDHVTAVAPQPVTFTVTSGGGTLSATQGDTKICDETPTCTVTTSQGSSGVVSWRLGVGLNTVQVSTDHVANSPQLITATGSVAQPVLAYRHSEQYPANGLLWDQYRLTVTNRSDFPASMFTPAPDLPPCGLNANSSQSWVNIYDGTTNARIYGFCGLTAPDQLNDIWFAISRWTQPPASVYITITDRRANVVYTSNTVSLFGPLFVNFPRQVELDWSAVLGAASYEIEMQSCDSWASPDWRTCNLAWTPWTHLLSYTAGVSYIDTFVGDQPGRWRVRANDVAGNPIGTFTDYQYFTYITGPTAP
jgi:hypothetical protein